MEVGPGSSPRLHRSVSSYCNRPVFAARFIPADETNPPTNLHYLLFERKSRVYGQILIEHHRRRYPEHPLSEPADSSLTELAWETRDHYDPLVIGERTADALVTVAQRISESDPILDVVNVMNKNYDEIGEFLNTRFGTPFAEFQSELKEPDSFDVIGGGGSQPTGIENLDSV